MCSLSSRFISKTFLLFIQLSYSEFPARQKFLRESALGLRVWMKHALHESVQLSWYSYLLILDTNKTSGHVSFYLNLDLNLETSMWKSSARALIKCGGRIYILLKLILNIKNAANVVLLNYSYFELLLLQYVFKKNVECLKNNYHNTGKTGFYSFSRPPNYTYHSSFYNHYHSKNE